MEPAGEESRAAPPARRSKSAFIAALDVEALVEVQAARSGPQGGAARKRAREDSNL
jgi:hypothetical protein